jgi:Abnormal spindle-like microcephaly-assoc'd, ASPM-SPD-2-Hydin
MKAKRTTVLYTGRGLGYSLFLTRAGVLIVPPMRGKTDTNAGKHGSNYFTLSLAGANPDASVQGLDKLPGKSNYCGGSDPRFWYTNIPQYAEVDYVNLYPGIDVIFYLRGQQLEYDIAAPGTDLGVVHLKVAGVRPTLTRGGYVALRAGDSTFVLKKPRVYLARAPEKLVPVKYLLHGNDVSFRLGRYDHRQAIILDPALVFSTFLNSNCIGYKNISCQDSVAGLAADASGVYLTGSTNASTFPSSNPTPSNDYTGYFQTFAIKIDPSGSKLLYSTFLSSSSGLAITVDASGAAYVSGTAIVPPHFGSSFPLTSGVFSGTVPANAQNPTSILYAAKLSPAGTLEYSTLLQQPDTTGAPVLTLAFGGTIPTVTVPLSGIGTSPAVTVSPTSLSFGVQANGTPSAAQQLTITNSGTGPLVISSVQTTSEFAATSTCGASIVAQGTCTVQVTFTPTASGPQTGSLTITDNASNSPQTVSLAGNQPANFSLAVSNGGASSATVKAGQTATYNLTVGGMNGFSGSVAFSCSGAPAASMCSVTPNLVNISGTAGVPLAVSVATTAASLLPWAHWYAPNTRQRAVRVCAALIFALLLYFVVVQPRSDLRKRYLGVIVVATVLAALAGCVASSPSTSPQSGTQTGQHTIIVSGTSGTLNESVTLTLLIQ